MIKQGEYFIRSQISMVFIKTKQSIDLKVTPPLITSRDELVIKRREKIEERIARTELAPRTNLLSLKEADFEQVDLLPTSPEDFLIMSALVNGFTDFEPPPIKVIFFPEEAFILVEVEPYLTAEDWRHLATKITHWRKNHLPTAVLENEVNMAIKTWHEWEAKCQLQHATAIIYSYYAETELGRWWIKLPISVNYSYIKENSRQFTELINRAGKPNRTRDRRQSTQFVTDPFGYGLSREGKKTDQAIIEAYEKNEAVDSKESITNFLESFSDHTEAKEEYSRVLQKTVARHKSLISFVESVKRGKIDQEDLDPLFAKRNAWHEAKAIFSEAKQKLRSVELTLIANKMEVFEIEALKKELASFEEEATELKIEKRYEAEIKMQMVIDQAFYSACAIYRGARKYRAEKIISLLSKILELRRSSVTDLIKRIIGLQEKARIPLLPKGLKKKIINANSKYKGFDEDRAWEEYYRNNPRTAECAVYWDEEDYLINGFSFHLLMDIYRELDEFGY